MTSDSIVADVPCNGCTACCRGEIVMLFPEHGDNPKVLAQHFDLGGKLILEQTDSGDCVYLKDGGCSVWEDRPAMCRAFDCRRHYQSFTRSERRRMVKSGIASRSVFDAGRSRLHTLKTVMTKMLEA